MKPLPIIFCAIDTNDIHHAQILIKALADAGCGIKLGLEFFNSFGPQGIKQIMDACGNPPLFLDLKYHDIPNTVASAIKAVSTLGMAYLNVHAAGGVEMMKAAKDACPPTTKLLAVTILTSLDEQAICDVGYQSPLEDRVIQMAALAQKAGLDGVVCSSHEIELIRKACGKDFFLMVPGIRPAGSGANDQKRIMTPIEAVNKGASHLVIGRPITQASNPVHAYKDIIESLS